MIKHIFEWDNEKEAINIKRHGVSFDIAQEAFVDTNRIIVHDEAHSLKEERLFCIGKTSQGILTVRFTHRGNKIRIIGAGKWRKGKKFYEKTHKTE